MLPDYFLSLHLFSAHIDDDYDELGFFCYIFFNFVLFVMQIVIQGLFFCSAQHRQRNEILWAVCLIDAFLYQLYTLLSDL